MGRSNLGWLQSIFHFSFAEYYNPKNMNFGSLRVVNDDLVKSNTGFPTHPHKDMEIVSYVVKGDLTHGDSMGNENTLTRGQVQYMSAGTGVYHSEYNLGDNTLRFLQIWILPDNTGYKPNYGDYRFTWEERKNKWLHMVSSKSGNAPIKINQDFNIYSIELDSNEEINFPVNKGRQAYILQVEGSSSINEILLNERDAAEVIEENIYIKAKNTSHILVLEMKKDE
jgi:redox-sensitive bicupin YhaK (pirin superfamily)